MTRNGSRASEPASEHSFLTHMELRRVTIVLEGPKSDLDAHLNWVADTAALANWDLGVRIVQIPAVKEIEVMARDLTQDLTRAEVVVLVPASTHFDALMMGGGLASPRDGSTLHQVSISSLRLPS